jgi:hypothetical protein
MPIVAQHIDFAKSRGPAICPPHCARTFSGDGNRDSLERVAWGNAGELESTKRPSPCLAGAGPICPRDAKSTESPLKNWASSITIKTEFIID